ncbi:MAG: hypothetical protein INH41_17145, partial [Myxococcaceae bacterium]|nr:hypothetical protein [Myxococcaceae bacterium]
MALRSAFVLLLLGACSSIDNPPAGRCDGVRCATGARCDEATGLCVGPPDAGALDAGRGDAGVDGGFADAGRADAGADDAGPALDAGADGGRLDAGPSDAGRSDGGATDAGDTDAGAGGCSSDPECFGVQGRCDVTSGRCVECLVDGHCPSAIPKCDVVRRECVECLSNVDCANPRPTCRARACDDCNALGECGPGQTCELLFGDCAALPDSCSAPQLLAIADAGGSAFVRVDLATAIDDLTTSCGQGGDLVYAFDLSGPRDVTITARALPGSLATPAVALRAAPCVSGSELSCDRARDGGSAASLAVSNLPAGRYFVALESAGGASGRVELGVTAVPQVTAAANDTCAQVEPLTFFGTRAIAVGSTLLATNDGLGPSCSPTAAATGGDLVYSYDVDGGSRVTVVARPLVGST